MGNLAFKDQTENELAEVFQERLNGLILECQDKTSKENFFSFRNLILDLFIMMYEQGYEMEQSDILEIYSSLSKLTEFEPIAISYLDNLKQAIMLFYQFKENKELITTELQSFDNNLKVHKKVDGLAPFIRLCCGAIPLIFGAQGTKEASTNQLQYLMAMLTGLSHGYVNQCTITLNKIQKKTGWNIGAHKDFIFLLVYMSLMAGLERQGIECEQDIIEERKVELSNDRHTNEFEEAIQAIKKYILKHFEKHSDYYIKLANEHPNLFDDEKSCKQNIIDKEFYKIDLIELCALCSIFFTQKVDPNLNSLSNI